MNQYKHLAPSQRCHIYQCLKLTMTQSTVAKRIDVNKLTISREIAHNIGNVTSKLMSLLVKDSPCQSIKNDA